MSNVVEMPGVVRMRAFVDMDDEKFLATELVLKNLLRRRRLVRTQIEELLALYRHYPLPEFESVRQILTQLQQAYSDVEPFNHPLLACALIEDDDELAVAMFNVFAAQQPLGGDDEA
jgi:hypothetical protein